MGSPLLHPKWKAIMAPNMHMANTVRILVRLFIRILLTDQGPKRLYNIDV